MIYFVRHQATGLIKIGTTNNIKQRLYWLIKEHGDCELLGLTFGFEHEEAEAHHQFRHLSSVGVLKGNEWFNPARELMTYIRKNTSMIIPLPFGVRKPIGHIEVKRLKDKRVIRDENGKSTGNYEAITRSYLYYRYAESVPNDSNRIISYKAKLKSVYIGGLDEGKARRSGGYPYQKLAEYFQSMRDSSQKGGRGSRRTQNNELYELEYRIVACIDTSKTPVVIDHHRLKMVQDELVTYESLPKAA